MDSKILSNASDRELLEMAAKAIGYRAKFNLAGACQLWTDDLNSEYIRFWYPLTDDGDALRLAVSLNLDILQDPVKLKSNRVEVVANEYGDEERMLWASEHRAPDPLAATRRAIVRAAAAIGAAK
jgi:hypothetical protein